MRNSERGEIPSGEFAGTLAVGMPRARMRTKSAGHPVLQPRLVKPEWRVREAHRTTGARRLKCDLVCGSAEPDNVPAF